MGDTSKPIWLKVVSYVIVIIFFTACAFALSAVSWFLFQDWGWSFWQHFVVTSFLFFLSFAPHFFGKPCPFCRKKHLWGGGHE